jgi:hypothetical protein
MGYLLPPLIFRPLHSSNHAFDFDKKTLVK